MERRDGRPASREDTPRPWIRHLNPHMMALVRARAGGPKSSEKQVAVSISSPQATDAQRARPAHAVVQQFERHGIADLEIVEGRSFFQIGTMKEDRAAVPATDLAVTLSDLHADDAARRGLPPQIDGPCVP
jgi:hypothetical protein